MIRKILWLMLACVCLSLGSAGAANRASFDCAKAGTPVEKAICADGKLAAADLQLGKLFTDLVAAHPGHAADLRRDQRAWLSQRNTGCKVYKGAALTDCVSRSYQDQIARLSGKNLLVCGAPRETSGKFSLNCDAVNDPAGLSLVLAGHDADHDTAALDSLTVRRNGAPPQTLPLQDAEIFRSGLRDAPAEVVELVDANFDGHADIKLWTSTSAGPNNGYSYWLFDPGSGKFQATELGDKLSGFEVNFDARARTITTSARASCCEWEMQTFRWVGSRLMVMTIETDRVYKDRIPPLAKLDDVELCATQTDHYNEREELVSNDIGPCERDIMEGDMKRSAFVALLRKNPKGYRVAEKDKNHLTITYDKPMPGYADP